MVGKVYYWLIFLKLGQLFSLFLKSVFLSIDQGNYTDLSGQKLPTQEKKFKKQTPKPNFWKRITSFLCFFLISDEKEFIFLLK